MVDWVTASSLATAGGTLVLAAATFASVRSANRAARVAEDSLLLSLRPLLVPSRFEDAPVKVTFADGYLARTPGGAGTAVVTGEAIYLTLSVRNVGSGIAVLHGWRIEPSLVLGPTDRPPLESFRRLTRDIYIAAGDVGFWQGALRDKDEPEWPLAAERIARRERIIVDVLYGDHQGGQRVVSRFSLTPRDTDGWLAAVSQHWNVDRPDPR